MVTSVLALASPAFAQTGDEIVVIGKAPLGFKASRLSRDDLDRVGAQAPAEALNRLAGISIQRNNGLENLPAIRSPVLTGGQSAGSFLILEDGVPIRAAGFANVNQIWETSLDVAARVDVVRGPGGASYGSNAVHGLIDVRTPDVDAPPFASLRLGGFGRAQGAALLHAGEMTIGAAAETDTGWRAFSGLDRQALFLRYDGRVSDWDVTATAVAQSLNQETASFIEGQDAYKSRALSRANPTPEAYRDTQLARGRVTASRPLDADWRLSLTGFARWIDADLNLSFFPSRAQEITRQIGGGAQARFESDAWRLGVDFDQTRGSLREVQSRPTTGTFTQGLHYDFAVDMTALSAFAEWRGAIGDTRIVAGLRGERVRYDYDNRAPNNDVGRFRRIADRRDSFDAITPKLGFSRALFEGEAYLNLARGARPPQITDLYALQTTQTPGGQRLETIDSAELGWRGDVLGAALDVSLYHMDKRGSAFRNADGLTVTGAATRHQGVEVALRAPLSSTVRLDGWVAYARHTYQFSDVSSRLGESIRAGDDIDTSPRWTSNTRLVWAASSDLELELEWAHMGAYATNAANTRRYPGHDLLNLRADWAVSRDVSIGLALRNVADVTYAERADFAFGVDRFFPGEPRSLSVAVRWNPSDPASDRP